MKPAAQGVQLVELAAAAKEPTGQGVHEDEFADAEKEPAAHTMQGVSASPTLEPAGHRGAAATVVLAAEVELTDVELTEVELTLVALHESELPEPDEVKLAAQVQVEGRAVAFPAVEFEFDGHAMQVDEVVLKKKLAAQDVHEVAPVEVVQLPAAQAEQLVELAADAKVPAGQSVQEDELAAAEKEPAAHTTQGVVALLTAEPGGQTATEEEVQPAPLPPASVGVPV